ncbi:MAG: CtsR family transcriptional regulator [Tissierellia bacterium]|nr:CtsR family transcriptional regulator [Tissierellia bacterium]
MARLSNHIEEYIIGLLEEANGSIDIQRNVLADYFGCAPSQINYVLSTRFTPYRGYYVESRRGGGGYIRIVRVSIEEMGDPLSLFQEEVGSSITKNGADGILKALMEQQVITERERELLSVALSDRALSLVIEERNQLRAEILQNLLLGILSRGGA